MKQFQTPEMEILRFAVEDVITSSDLRDDELEIVSIGDNELPLTMVD